MPRKKSTAPGYRYHVSGQAVVTLDGRNFYLGQHDSPESHAKYHALLAEYNANGLRMPRESQTHKEDQPVTVRCITAEFREHIKTKYAGNATQRGRFRNLCTLLDDEYADLPANEFGPRKLSAIRDLLVVTRNRRGKRNTRRYINGQVHDIVRIFKYAVSRELVDPTVVVALETLESLRYGQTEAEESIPVEPVDIESVRLTAQHLSPTIKAMVRIQAATGMRPSEV